MRSLTLAMVLAAATAVPGNAEVLSKSDTGFAVGGSTTVTATPEQTWRRLVTPARWWSKDHTWSHNSANLTIDPRPGGAIAKCCPGPEARRAAR
jgi:uncharacterized protein YndB with AHSA1/START domain